MIGLAEDELEASVQVFFVRQGRVVGRKGLVVDKVEDVDTPELVGRLLEQLYGDAPADDVPREVLVPGAARGSASSTRSSSARCAGSKVRVRVPQRGSEARAARDRHAERARRRSRSTSCKRASRPQRAGACAHRAAGRARPARGAAAHRVLRHLEPAGHRDRRLDGRDGGRAAEAVRLPAVQGPAPGGPGRLRRDGGGADAAASAATSTSATRARATGKRFAYPPNLLLVDGGKGQLGVAVRVLEELGLEDICGRRAGQALRGGVPSPAERSRCASRATPRRCTCSSRCATRPTGSRSRTTASCASKSMIRSVLDDVPGPRARRGGRGCCASSGR